MIRFILAGALVMTVTALSLPACDQGAQGDRCNPYLYEDAADNSPNGAAYNASECNSGLACTIPPTCVIAVCCPTSPPYSDPSCECLANPGAACACSVSYLLDAGEDAGPADAGSDSSASDSGSGAIDSGSDSAAAADGASLLEDATAE